MGLGAILTFSGIGAVLGAVPAIPVGILAGGLLGNVIYKIRKPKESGNGIGLGPDTKGSYRLVGGIVGGVVGAGVQLVLLATGIGFLIAVPGALIGMGAGAVFGAMAKGD